MTSKVERALVDHLRAAGHDVIGNHPRSLPCDAKLCEQVRRLVDEALGAEEPDPLDDRLQPGA